MNVYVVGWLAIAVCALGLEGLAIHGKRKAGQVDTLSSLVQWCVRRQTWVRHVTLGLWAGFAVWFAVHIWA